MDIDNLQTIIEMVVKKFFLIAKETAPLIVSIIVVYLNHRQKNKELNLKIIQEEKNNLESRGFDLVKSLILFDSSLQKFSNQISIMFFSDEVFDEKAYSFFKNNQNKHDAELNNITALTKFYFNDVYSNIKKVIDLNDKVVMLIFNKNEELKKSISINKKSDIEMLSFATDVQNIMKEIENEIYKTIDLIVSRINKNKKHCT